MTLTTISAAPGDSGTEVSDIVPFPLSTQGKSTETTVSQPQTYALPGNVEADMEAGETLSGTADQATTSIAKQIRSESGDVLDNVKKGTVRSDGTYSGDAAEQLTTSPTTTQPSATLKLITDFEKDINNNFKAASVKKVIFDSSQRMPKTTLSNAKNVHYENDGTISVELVDLGTVTSTSQEINFENAKGVIQHNEVITLEESERVEIKTPTMTKILINAKGITISPRGLKVDESQDFTETTSTTSYRVKTPQDIESTRTETQIKDFGLFASLDGTFVVPDMRDTTITISPDGGITQFYAISKKDGNRMSIAGNQYEIEKEGTIKYNADFYNTIELSKGILTKNDYVITTTDESIIEFEFNTIRCTTLSPGASLKDKSNAFAVVSPDTIYRLCLRTQAEQHYDLCEHCGVLDLVDNNHHLQGRFQYNIPADYTVINNYDAEVQFHELIAMESVTVNPQNTIVTHLSPLHFIHLAVTDRLSIDRASLFTPFISTALQTIITPFPYTITATEKAFTIQDRHTLTIHQPNSVTMEELQ